MSSSGSGKLTWRITGLSNAFNQNNYIKVGITKYMFTQGGVSSISGIVDYQNAPSSGTSTSSASNTVSYENGFHTFWGFGQTANGLYWPAGSDSVQIGLERPRNWSWDNVYSGADMISATEWNYFTSKINEFREYKDLSRYSFTNARRNDFFYAYMFNEARNAIDAMYNSGVSQKYSGDKIYASDLNALKNALNNIS